MSTTQSHPYPNMPPMNNPALQSAEVDEFDYSGMILRGKWFIIFGLACGLGVAYWFFSRATPLYRSTSQILVTHLGESHSGIEALDSESDYRHNLSTQIVLIRSPKLIQRSVIDHELKDLSSLAGSGSPARSVLKGLSITQEQAEGDLQGRIKEDVLTISYEGPEADDCPKIVSAVINTYSEFLQESHEDFSDEVHRLLFQTRKELMDQLTEKEIEYRKFRTETPEIWLSDGKTTIFRSRLQGIEEQKSALFLEKTGLIAEASAIEKALKSGGNREALRLMVSGLAEKKAQEGEDTSISVVGQLFPMLLEEQLLLDTLGTDHPKVTSLRKRIALTRNHLTSMGLDLKTENKNEPKKDFITIYLDSLKQQIQLTELKETELNRQLENQREEVKKTIAYENKDLAMKNEIARIRSLFDTVVARLGEVTLVKNVGQYKMHVINPAGMGKQVSPNFLRMMTIGGIIGLLSGVCIAFLREYTDKRFTAPDDIEKQLGVPVIGHVPNLDKQKRQNIDSKINEKVYSFYHPRSKYSEAIRTVRTALYFSTHRDRNHVLQVTSPHPGDGKTTVAVNLAVSIACSGKQVLIIDADLRKPRLHNLLGVKNDVGLATTIAEGNQGDPLTYVQESDVPNLWCLPSGERPPNPAELLTSSIFEQFLEIAREKFDYVIVDTPPVLAVTDPSTVSARVDGVILVLRLKNDTRVTASRATDILSAVDANCLGVVVNGAGRFESFGYGRGGDGKNEQYGYGYGYGDDYGDFEKGQKQKNKNGTQSVSVIYDSKKHPKIPASALKQDETSQ